MGAHSATGHVPARTVTAAAGVAAALVTTATTGVLIGGTAFATDGYGSGGHDGSGGHGRHAHGHDASRSWHDGDDDAEQAAGPGLAGQTLCDVLGDVDLGGGSCASDDDGSGAVPSGSPESSDDGDVPGLGMPVGQADQPATGSAASPAATATPSPAPAPKPTSSVPDHPTVQRIGAPAAGTVPIG